MVQPTQVMLIDASDVEEIRVAVADVNGRLVNFDSENNVRKTIKGHIFLSKVARVEPALQAAFVDYGGARHGFLAFEEIHPDYFRIPVADRENRKVGGHMQGISDDKETKEACIPRDNILGDTNDQAKSLTKALHHLYKIQEVIQKNQVILAQVIKEERSGKGAVLSTYLSLAGRYCVLMPNSPNSKGVSRKISSQKERSGLRRKLKEIAIPAGMGLIIRTAGRQRTQTEIKRDVEHLMRTWNETRELMLQSVAPALIYEEDDIIKRSIRDYYTKDIKEILVAGDGGYKAAKRFMKSLIPSHTRRVRYFKENSTSLFTKHKIEAQIDAMYEPEVRLPSGGSIVIQPTEALISIDINSGKSTRDRHIEETALHTNLEAAEEVARQVLLRDLAGLLVIDFIDMEETNHISQVERRVRESFRNDRARVQIGRISPFGLLEISRQRLRPSVLETTSKPCPHCYATGLLRAKESVSSMILHILEEEGLKGTRDEIQVVVPMEVAFHLLNIKKASIWRLEQRYTIRIEVLGDPNLLVPNYTLNSPKRQLDSPLLDSETFTPLV